MKLKGVVLIIVLIAIAGAIVYINSKRLSNFLPSNSADIQINQTKSMVNTEKNQQYPLAKELVSPSGFINSQPFHVQDLIGKKVILVDFWTYSCINCQRTIPYLNAWYQKYKDEGLEIIGVHTPEFEFEKKIENVKKAVAQYGIQYPVVLDNDYGTWSNYENRYWPHKYLIDIDGYIVYDHIGEGGYEETEQKIQALLTERQHRLHEQGTIASGTVSPINAETLDPTKPYSPEIYFGSARNTYLGNGQSNIAGLQTLTEPRGLKTNILYLVGDWNFFDEYAQNQGPAKIIFRYQGQKVFMVAAASTPVTAKILRDGQPIGDAAGTDVKNGTVTISADQLYRIIEDPAGWGEHTLEIIIDKPGLQAFTFTFG